jgi:hypothetical protein
LSADSPTRTSYRDLLPPEGVGREDAANLYLDFLKECPHASEDTKRKMKRRLGL